MIIYTEGTRAQVTSCKESTLNPNWNEIKNLELAGADSVVHLVMFDRNRMVKDEFMGELVLPLAEMPLDRGESLDAWYKLEQPASRSGDSVSGELRLIIRVSDVRESASRVRREAMPLGGAPEEETAGARARRRDGEGLSMFDGPEEKLKRGRGGGARLRMRVIEAEGLISRDSNGRSDPFASVHVDGSTWRTKTIERTLAPVWSEEAKEPPITSADAVVHVILFDQDGMMKKSDYLGEVLIPVSLLADGAPHDHWLQLRSPAGHEVRAKGRVRLEMELLHHEKLPRSGRRKGGSEAIPVDGRRRTSSSYDDRRDDRRDERPIGGRDDRPVGGGARKPGRRIRRRRRSPRTRRRPRGAPRHPRHAPPGRHAVGGD